MARRNVVVKRLSAVETLGSATVICVDKTGTITEGQMTAKRIWVGGLTYDVTGEGYEPTGVITIDGRDWNALDRPDLRPLLLACALNNNASLTPPIGPNARWKAIGDPTEAALLVLASKSGMQQKDLTVSHPRIGLIPFDTTRKMMTSVNRAEGTGTMVSVKGAGTEVLSRCTRVIWEDAIIPLTDEIRRKILDRMDSFAFEAFRVLAFAQRDLSGPPSDLSSVSIEADLTFVGMVALHDPPRAEVSKAVQMARGAGIRVMMLTGDHELTARAIAQRVGIVTDSGVVMTGRQLEGLSDERLSESLDAPELVFARITAGQKHRIVRLLRSKGEVVAVTGDGVNDVPALLEADIGVAMGASGTDVAREAGDMVLLDDNFASIVGSIEEGRAAFDNLKKFLVYVFTHNWAELVAFIAFVLLQTPLPLAVVQVLAIDLFLEIPSSLSLTLDPPDKGTMDRPPRSRTARIFDASALSRTLYMGAIIGVFALFWCFNIWSQHGWHIGLDSLADSTAYLQGTTVMMVGIMAGQLATLIIVRSDVRSNFTLFGTRNKWILRALLIEMAMLLALIYLPFLQTIFRTAAIPPIYWVLLYSIVPVLLAIEVLRRAITRWAYGKARAGPSDRPKHALDPMKR
jgi:potassium/sodium efflux P-type ATPase